MTVNLSLPVLISGSPAVGSLAAAEQSHPEIQQSVHAQEALDKLKKDKEQVRRGDNAEGSIAVKDDEEGGGKGGHGGTGHRKHKQEEDGPPVETEAHSESPWAGQILNKKI